MLDATHPFGSVHRDRAAAAWADVGRAGDLAPAARDGLVDGLVGRLSGLAGPALLALYREGGSDRSRPGSYRRFVDAVAARDESGVAAAFPVLGDLLDLVAGQWTAAVRDLLDHHRADHAETFGPGPCPPIERVRWGLGDAHDGGRMVAAVAVGEARWAYKPRPLAAEIRFDEAARWAADRSGITLELPRMVDGGDHGWVEWVLPAPCRDAAGYWRRAGLVTAVATLTTTADLHNENVIATATNPVLVDLECVDQPRLWQAHGSGGADAPTIADTVMGTGLLPGHYRDRSAVALELCGLLAHGDQTGGSRRPQWDHLGTDRITVRSVLSQWGTPHNRPRRAGGGLVPVDLPAFLAGLEAGLGAGTDPAFPARGWDDRPVRVLLRSTRSYAGILAELRQPSALANRAAFAAAVDGLEPFAPEVVTHLGPHLEAVVESERAALSRLDVPRHRAQGPDLLLDRGPRLAGVVGTTGGEVRRARLAALGPAAIGGDLALARLAIEQHERIPPELGPVGPSAVTTAPGDDRLAAAASTLGRQILAEHLGPGGDPVWIDVDQSSAQAMGATVGDTSLYLGRAGIAVAFASLAALTGEQEWVDAAQRTLPPEPEGGPVSWDSGRAGWGYAAMTVGDLVQDPGRAEEGRAAIGRALAPPLDGIGAVDVIGGWAGVVDAGLAALERRPDDALAAQVVAATTTLVDAVSAGLDDEVERRRLTRPGFAHGVTGLAFTCARAAHVTGHRSGDVLADALIAIEAGQVAAHDRLPGRVARARGRGGDPATTWVGTESWCWGFGGYVCAHTAPEMAGRAPGGDEVLGAVTARLATGGLGASHHLCCGDAGRVLALGALARAGHGDAGPAADGLAGALCAAVEAGAPWRFYAHHSFPSPSLMWGRAGIAYALCRVAAPDVVPDLLTIR